MVLIYLYLWIEKDTQLYFAKEVSEQNLFNSMREQLIDLLILNDPWPWIELLDMVAKANKCT